MTDGVTESTLAALAQCRDALNAANARAVEAAAGGAEAVRLVGKELVDVKAERDACMNELHERNNDLADWKPKVQALVDALTEISGNGYGVNAEPRAANIALEALDRWHGDQ